MTRACKQLSHLSSMQLRSLLVLASLLLLATTSYAQVSEDSVVTLTVSRPPVTGPSPVTQSFIVSPPPGGVAAAKKVLILLPGRTGDIQLTPASQVATFPGSDGTLDVNSGNFLVRSRWLLASQGFVVITLDSATDFQQLPSGLVGQQGSYAHVTDVLQVIAWARAIPGLPANIQVWLVGTSRGTAGAWVAGGSPSVSPVIPPNPPPTGPDGLVFTSPINTTSDVDSLLAAPLGSITVPTLIFNNKASTCASALATGDTAVLKALTSLSTTVAPLKANQNVSDAGFPALSSNCEALSPHGYFGIEPEVVTKISTWIIAN